MDQAANRSLRAPPHSPHAVCFSHSRLPTELLGLSILRTRLQILLVQRASNGQVQNRDRESEQLELSEHEYQTMAWFLGEQLRFPTCMSGSAQKNRAEARLQELELSESHEIEGKQLLNFSNRLVHLENFLASLVLASSAACPQFFRAHSNRNF